MSGGADIAGGSGSIAEANVNIARISPAVGSNPALFSVLVKLNSTVEDFRPVVHRNCSVIPQRQLLICNGRIMTDKRTLNSYGLKHNGTVDLLEYRDAALLNEYFAEDSVGDLGILDGFKLEKLARNPDAIRFLHEENTQMRATCDRNLVVLNRIKSVNALRALQPPPPQSNIGSSSRQLAAGGRSAFQMFSPQSAPKPPLPSTTIRSDPRVNPQLQTMHPSNPQTPRSSHVVVHQVSPEMESEQNVELTLGLPQNAEGAAPQKDGAGTSAGGEAGERFFNIVREEYAVQVSELQQKGFTDIQEITIALFGTVGDVNAAADKLRSNLE